MSGARLRPWFEAGEREYHGDLIRAGKSPEQADVAASQSFEEYFPGGVPAPGHHVFDVLADDEPVGYVWIGPQTSGDPQDWWLWDIAIDDRHRGRGLGRAAVELAEAEAVRRGARSLGLKVFGFNTAARSLYESLGYDTVSLLMTKRLT
ncbi:GNAT family N-acetyltransferase [Pengzhenrongella frigida]|uniref:GNAT family N-acetyltransferase n=1 Tax=Pengzhenrongella frigida TaxID=1259133 RepID=A0A4Q5MZG3_9MICO|nr:GNAT family N-acetyltransferase [Cellulomonas sp. HLT2-17]RYV51119.1 GNAT family N-acetyltransferase [Cellulomonas sp. HLT2-17]